MALIIGVAGAIATGKSTACEIMTGLGAVHCDADRLVHRLYDPGKPAFDRIVAIFGDEVVGDDGYIDRRILGSRVFGRPAEMNKLTTAIGDINAAVRGVFRKVPVEPARWTRLPLWVEVPSRPVLAGRC